MPRQCCCHCSLSNMQCSGCASYALYACPCGRAEYCNRVCQKSHWKTHKAICIKAYATRVESILTNVLQEFPELNAVAKLDDIGGAATHFKLMTMQLNSDTLHQVMCIRVDDTVGSIFTRIRRLLHKQFDKHECPVCFEEDGHRVTCQQCDGHYCFECMIRMYEEYDLHRCPHCRFDIDFPCVDKEAGIREMRLMLARFLKSKPL
jgi:hypothetical protein